VGRSADRHDALDRLRRNWDGIKARLVGEVDAAYGVYVLAGLDLDPTTRFGAEVLDTARRFAIDPYTLAEVAYALWRQDRDRRAETADALCHARQMTGLTAARVRRLTDAGDQAERLFDRRGKPDPRPRHEWVRDAAERLTAGGLDLVGHCSGAVRFSSAKFADYLARAGIAWPRLASGALDLSDDTVREMARIHPDRIGPLRELRHTLGQMRLHELTVGPDGRNRCLLSMFASKTGRNQPSNKESLRRPVVLAAVADPPGRGPRGRLRGLVPAGTRDRRGAVG
jgi:hypothetical protein